MFSNFLTYITCLHGLISLSASAEEHGHQRFIAAQKGNPPPCVLKPGETFCEEVDYYPHELVINAIHRSKFDVTKFLVNESENEGPDLRSLRSPTDTVKAGASTYDFTPLISMGRIMRSSPHEENVRVI